MSIAKADIITFVNDTLRESLSGTELDVPIQTCLNDLSNENLLVASDTDTTLASGDLSIDYPTNFKELITIFLTSASGVQNEPLEALKEGYWQYRQLRDNDSSTGEPQYYTEYNDKFWLWRPSNGVYTVQIDYYRYHPQDVDTILFGDEFKNAVNFGTAYYKALFMKRKDDIALWLPVYLNEKNERRAATASQPYIVRS